MNHDDHRLFRVDTTGRPTPMQMCIGHDVPPAEKWRFRRNFLIYAARRQGFDMADLAAVFGLGSTQVRHIVREFENHEKVYKTPLVPRVVPERLVEPKNGDGAKGELRSRRDRVIRMAWNLGLSQRYIADVFDLPRARVAQIIKETSDGASWHDGEHELARERGVGQE
jgi:hypothetical protein